MAITSRKRQPRTARDYQLARIVLWLLVLVGPAFIFKGVRGNYGDRPSLKWPVTTATVIQSEPQYHGGKHSHYDVNFAYSYIVNGKRYIGHKIRLWNSRLNGDRDAVKAFVADYHVRSEVDIHYDPQYPENAVLFPGADEFGNRLSIWCGSIIFVLSAWLVFRSQPMLARLIAEKKAEEATAPTMPKREEIIGLPHAFVTYEPDSKRKLNCFSDKEELFDVLGHDGEGIQEWKAEDRVIDTAGRAYRLIKTPGKKRYDIEPAGETWSTERLLGVAVADARLLKQDEDALRRRVGNATADQRMAVLMKCIDELPAGPKWAMIGLIVFLVLFFIAVFVVGYIVATAVGKR